MTGTNKSIALVSLANNPYIDGLIFGYRWNDATINYGFSNDRTDYGAYQPSPDPTRPLETNSFSSVKCCYGQCGALRNGGRHLRRRPRVRH